MPVEPVSAPASCVVGLPFAWGLLRRGLWGGGGGVACQVFMVYAGLITLGQFKKIVMLPSPDQII